MWALSACVSAHSQDTATDHYGQARQALAGLEIQCNATEIPVEQVQAWMLLAIYEFMRVDFQKGWLSAGRAFRLVQLMRLYELDSTPSVHLDFDFTDTESKRRTFWMAYLLDRFISISNGYQLTLNELVVCYYDTSPTRVRADKSARYRCAFQHQTLISRHVGQPSQASCLRPSELKGAPSTTLSPSVSSLLPSVDEHYPTATSLWSSAST